MRRGPQRGSSCVFDTVIGNRLSTAGPSEKLMARVMSWPNGGTKTRFVAGAHAWWKPRPAAIRSATLPRPHADDASCSATMSASRARSPSIVIATRRSRRPSSPQRPEDGPPWKTLKVTTVSGLSGAAAMGVAIMSTIAKSVSQATAGRTSGSERERLAGRGHDAGHIGDRGALAREARERHVVGRDAPDRRLEREERAVHDRGRDLRARSEAPRRLVDDDRAPRLAHRGRERIAVERRDRLQVDQLALRAVLLLEALRGLAGHPHQRPPGDQPDVAPLAPAPRAHDPRAPDRQRLTLVGHLLPGGVVEGLGLEEHDGIGVANRADEQPAGGAGSRGHHHLQPRDVGVELLLGLRVVLERAHAAAVGHADHHLAMEAALAARPVARGVILDLVEALEGEAGELDLADGLE